MKRPEKTKEKFVFALVVLSHSLKVFIGSFIALASGLSSSSDLIEKLRVDREATRKYLSNHSSFLVKILN